MDRAIYKCAQVAFQGAQSELKHKLQSKTAIKDLGVIVIKDFHGDLLWISEFAMAIEFCACYRGIITLV